MTKDISEKNTHSSCIAIVDDCCNKDILCRESGDVTGKKPALLLHSCCGPCSTAVIERLVGEFAVTVFFYNPCITDEAEYRMRRQAQIDFIERFNEERMHGLADDRLGTLDADEVKFVEGPYCPGAFFEACKGHEKDPEGGDRCSLCFRQRLEKTAETAGMAGYDCFATTLTVSPHKSYKTISEIGKKIAMKYAMTFVDRDFKKRDGFKRSIELSKKYGLYRQNYCGCEFSKDRSNE